MRVSELARRTGVSAHRLRHYEELGLIQAERSASGYRQFAETLPRYRAGTLSFDELAEIMRHRIVEVDEQIAAQRAVRKKLVSHIAWLEKRKREFAKRNSEKRPSPWPTTRKSTR